MEISILEVENYLQKMIFKDLSSAIPIITTNVTYQKKLLIPLTKLLQILHLSFYPYLSLPWQTSIVVSNEA